jgi:hypothetical protein
MLTQPVDGNDIAFAWTVSVILNKGRSSFHLTHEHPNIIQGNLYALHAALLVEYGKILRVNKKSNPRENLRGNLWKLNAHNVSYIRKILECRLSWYLQFYHQK